MGKASALSKLGAATFNQLLIEACVFLRNMVIAKLLGAETLGQFIFLILGIRLLAMSTDLATDRYILQVAEHKVKDALSATHYINRVRSVFIAFVLLVMGLNNVHDISLSAYALLSASALARSYTHMGYRLYQRSLNFKPAIYVEGFSALMGLFGIYYASTMGNNLEALCAALFAQAILHTVLSHMMSDQPFNVETNTADLKSIAIYGWPLLLSGITMFWSMQGERLILSNIMPPAEFAHFAMLFQLALVPVLIISRIALSFGLPLLAKYKNAPLAFKHTLTSLSLSIYICALLFTFGFIAFSNFVLINFFGHDFRAEINLIIVIAALQALRLCRAPISIAAQAIGATDIPFKANLIRVSVILFSAGAALNGTSLINIMLIACIGEILAWAAQSIMFELRQLNKHKSVVKTKPSMTQEITQ